MSPPALTLRLPFFVSSVLLFSHSGFPSHCASAPYVSLTLRSLSLCILPSSPHSVFTSSSEERVHGFQDEQIYTVLVRELRVDSEHGTRAARK